MPEDPVERTSVPLTPTAPSAPPAAPIPASTAVRTAFNPAIHGFTFSNDFKNSFFGPPINHTSKGLCGGMSYAVLDYYYASLAIPTQDYRPANNTPIQQYLYARQVTTLVPNLDKWAELIFNPGGSRTTEFFNWGIRDRLVELKSFIDRGVPVPLGLHGLYGLIDGDHQVLAIGYDMGRYKGDLGDYKEDLKIFVLDPNDPNTTMTLVPDVAKREFYYLEDTAARWRAYFVDGKYARQAAPPTVVKASYPIDFLVHELVIAMTTGYDNMRGGADHVNVKVNFSNGTSQFFENVSQNGIWVSDYKETVRIILPQAVHPTVIQTIQISTNATGGLNGDNWDLVGVEVQAVIGGITGRKVLATYGGLVGYGGTGEKFRFTGDRIPLVIPVN